MKAIVDQLFFCCYCHSPDNGPSALKPMDHNINDLDLNHTNSDTILRHSSSAKAIEYLSTTPSSSSLSNDPNKQTLLNLTPELLLPATPARKTSEFFDRLNGLDPIKFSPLDSIPTRKSAAMPDLYVPCQHIAFFPPYPSQTINVWQTTHVQQLCQSQSFL